MTQSATAGLTGAVQHMCFLSVGDRMVLAVARNQGIELVDPDTGGSLRIIDPDRVAGAVHPLPSGPGATLLLAGGVDGTVRCYDPATGALVSSRRLGPGGVKDLDEFGENGARAVVAVLDSGVYLWHLEADEVTRLPDPPDSDPARLYRTCAYRAAATQWVTCAYTDGQLATWDLGRGTSALQRAHDGPIWSLIVTADGEDGDTPIVVSGGADRHMRAWRVGGAELVPREAFTADGTIRRLGHVSDQRTTMLITASASGAVALWRLDGSRDRPEFKVDHHSGEVWALACLTTDDGVVIASGDMNGQLKIKRLSTALLTAESSRVVYRSETTIWALTHGETADGTYLACAGVDQAVSVIDPTRARDPLFLRRHSSTVRALAAGGDPDRPHLVSGGADHRVLDWDPASGRLRAELPMGHVGEVWALATYPGPDGLMLVSGGADGTVRTIALDPAPGTVPVARVLATDCGEVNSLIPVPDGDDMLVVVGSSRGLRAVSTATGAGRPLGLHAVGVAAGLQDAGRHLVVSARQDGVVELIDPITGAQLYRMGRSYLTGQVKALHGVDVQGTVFVLGACDDGHVLVWHVDGTLVGTPARVNTAGIPAIDVVEIAPQASTVGRRAAMITGGQDGHVRLWPVTADSPLRSGGSVGRGVKPASILLQDQPSHDDHLARDPLVETLFDALTAEETRPPVVVGVHAPWGQGKSSLLRQLRVRIDPWSADLDANTNSRPDKAPTHTLAALPREPRWWQFRRRSRPPRVRLRLTRAWAWSQIQRSGDHDAPLAYEMTTLRPRDGRPAPITVWFNPWMYERTDQIWAGLTREILIAVTERLAKAERERLWFDLNLRRTDPTAMRKRIIASYIPRSLAGLLTGGLLLFTAAVAVVSMGVTAINSPSVAAFLGPTTLIMLAVLGTIAQLTSGSFKHIHGWVAPDELNSTAGPEHAWKGTSDPLTSTDRGYLYMLQHDVGSVVKLATANNPLYVFIDDLDRCGPEIVADTIEAINLFLNKAFGQCVFVVALDPATVAAHLETAFAGINDRARDDPPSFGHLRHTGWRFMEKIIDLPIRLPRVPDVALSQYLDRLLERGSGNAMSPAEPAAPDAQRVPRPRTPAGETAAAAAAPAAAPATDAPTTVEVVLMPSSGTPDAVAVVSDLETLAEVRDALRSAVLSLPSRNPRQTKAFVNLWRFYMVLEHRSGQFSTSRLAIERHSIEMARLVELMVRWPFLLDLLGEQAVEGDSQSPLVLDLLVEACEDDPAWAAAVAATRLDPADRSVVALRQLLAQARPHKHVFLPIAHRYL
ncbi:P-loop NTPase fold protein [Catellatospora sp. NPDC049609]|uniref:P-loop NTPase fold protein n=1 Tax=Catellatospora sp. NPDC049609 TaxID=3155505 RepID=UPI0034263423